MGDIHFNGQVDGSLVMDAMIEGYRAYSHWKDRESSTETPDSCTLLHPACSGPPQWQAGTDGMGRGRQEKGRPNCYGGGALPHGYVGGQISLYQGAGRRVRDANSALHVRRLQIKLHSLRTSSSLHHRSVAFHNCRSVALSLSALPGFHHIHCR
jgi:hypothetical protein